MLQLILYWCWLDWSILFRLVKNTLFEYEIFYDCTFWTVKHNAFYTIQKLHQYWFLFLLKYNMERNFSTYYMNHLYLVLPQFLLRLLCYNNILLITCSTLAKTILNFLSDRQFWNARYPFIDAGMAW